MAKDQDLRGLPRLLAPRQPQPRGDPRDQEEHEPQAHDRRSSRSYGRQGNSAGQTAVDEILGTHSPDMPVLGTLCRLGDQAAFHAAPSALDHL